MSSPVTRSRLATMAGIALSAALALTACGSDDDTQDQSSTEQVVIPDVKISYTISEDTEEVTLDGALDTDQMAAWIFAEGDGEVIEEGDLLQIFSVDVDIENEAVNAHDFDLGGQSLQLVEQFQAGNPQAYDALIGATVGSDMALYLPADSLGEGTPAYLNIISVGNKITPYANGEPVPATDLNDTLPTVTIDDETNAPSIATPEGDAPEDLVVDVLKQGEGPEVQADSKVTIHYRGVSWSNGEEFDSSWGPDNTGAPAAFELQQLISGWQEGLAGQKVGSQVLMSIPPELAYGGSEGHDLAEETLVFVIDILHSADPMTEE